jgi:hypothetical protein
LSIPRALKRAEKRLVNSYISIPKKKHRGKTSHEHNPKLSECHRKYGYDFAQRYEHRPRHIEVIVRPNGRLGLGRDGKLRRP